MESLNYLNLESYSSDERLKINRALDYACVMHKGQRRQSGEDYIVHPIEVAKILLDMNADSDTVCAGLLHDTIEDTKTTREDLENIFNVNIASLVDGVTKMSKLNFSNKSECDMANIRKIVMTTTEDIRIIIIKLADRLHNMRTLNFKSDVKQKEISLETLDLFVPLAYYTGLYKIKSELEDLALSYLKKDIYLELKEKINKITLENKDSLNQMKEILTNSLNKENIENKMILRSKNLYGVYKYLESGCHINDIHDLFALKIITSTDLDCYKSLGIVHNLYHPVNNRFKDYICNPKTNLYKSLHTTVFGPNDNLVHVQMRTSEMDLYAKLGIGAIWSIDRENAALKMNEISRTFPFQKSLVVLDKAFSDCTQFFKQIKREVFTNMIYVYVESGRVVELPYGSTIIDLAYALDSQIGNTLIASRVNGKFESVTYKLNNKDRVTLITDCMSYGPRNEWLGSIMTTNAKENILRFKRWS